MKVTVHPTTEQPSRVVLVLTVPPDEREHENDREAEMRSLLETAGTVVVAVLRQHLQKPVGRTYIGSGKVEELKQLAVDQLADEVVFDVALSPSQERNLEELVERHVVDYPGLILHIFARGARTHQASLAVELAQLEYNISRLKRMWSHLDRIKSGMNMRGPGEKQLEVDKRLARMRIQDLRGKLEEIEARKERTLAARADCFKVCLIGYTNAGKSSLMNALTQAGVLAEDRLFATLDTHTSRLQLGSHRSVVLSDTVGFIRNLPPALIASFHATLAEVVHADLLLHVVDASLPSMEDQMLAVEGVLDQIGAGKVPTVVVFNKIDRPHSRTILLAFRKRYAQSVAVSALTGDGLPDLRQAIVRHLDQGIRQAQVRFPAADGALAASIRRGATVLAESYEDDQAVWAISATAELLDQLRQQRQVRFLDSPGT